MNGLMPGQVLKDPVDFDNAMFFGISVVVWQEGEIIDYGGPIEKHSDEAVYINGGYFLKSTCMFKVR